jgi:hypothetical protein
MIQTSCPSCNRKLKLGDNLAGKQIRCPGCKNVFRVEAPAAPAAVEEAVVEESAPPPAPAKPRPAARPAPPPPPLEDDPFATDEPPPKPRAAARPAPPPAEEEDPFAVTEAPPVRAAARKKPAAEPEPEAEGLDEFQAIGAAGGDLKQARRAAKRGAFWLQMAFLFDLIPYVIFAVLFFVLTSGDRRGGGGGGAERRFAMDLVIALSVVYLVPVIFLAVGATMLASLKGRGLVITASILAFLMVPQLLVYAGFWGLVVLQNLEFGTGMMILMPLLVVVTSLLGVAMSILGGILGLMTLGKPEVKAAYR